jgi:hypothetical protein
MNVVENLKIEGFNVELSHKTKFHNERQLNISWDENSTNMAKLIYEKMINKIEKKQNY